MQEITSARFQYILKSTTFMVQTLDHNSAPPVCQAVHALYAYSVSLPTAEMMPTIYDEVIVNIRSCLAYITTFSSEITTHSICMELIN